LKSGCLISHPFGRFAERSKLAASIVTRNQYRLVILARHGLAKTKPGLTAPRQRLECSMFILTNCIRCSPSRSGLLTIADLTFPGSLLNESANEWPAPKEQRSLPAQASISPRAF